MKWASFGDDWFSGVLASQDPVAIDSVGFDFLRNEPRCTQVVGHPENYLHEMALADNPPSGTFYDPEHDGIRLESLGVHEHWNNAVQRQYSRNLGTGDGIELVVPPLTREDGPVQNLTQGTRYDFISHAIEEANDGDEIVAARGIYKESVSFADKAVTVRSENPNDPAVVAATIIAGGVHGVAFTGSEDANSALAGFTVTGAIQGIYCQGSSPAICNCRIVDNIEAGMKLWESSNPTVVNCILAGNGGDGVEMWAQKNGRGRTVAPNSANIAWCTIVGNGGSGVRGGLPLIVNTIVYDNGVDSVIAQITGEAPDVTYCDVKGGFIGTDNIDVVPGFITPGYWADPTDPELPAVPDDPAAVWVHGNYHLRQDSPCVDAGVAEEIFGWVATDIDGDSRTVGERPDIGCDESTPASQ
jgi:parallel beta-helix repeat protein